MAGEKAFPGSRGAELCRELRAQIEAPDFALQMMAVDGASRRSIEISHRNLGELHLRAYRVDLEAQLAHKEFRGLFPNDDREIERLISGSEPAAAWSVALPPTADFESHRTFATPPLTASGLYLIVASAERSFAKPGNRRVALPFTLSKLVLAAGESGLPVGGSAGRGRRRPGGGRSRSHALSQHLARGAEACRHRAHRRRRPRDLRLSRGERLLQLPPRRAAGRRPRGGAALRRGASGRDEPAHELSAVHRSRGLSAAAEALLESAGLRRRPRPRRALASARDAGHHLPGRSERGEGGGAHGHDEPVRHGSGRVSDSRRQAPRPVDSAELARRRRRRSGRGVQAARPSRSRSPPRRRSSASTGRPSSSARRATTSACRSPPAASPGG